MNASDIMQELYLRREKSADYGTFGTLTGQGSPLFTLELPWRNNERQRSCIPCGTYPCRIRISPRFGRVYEVADVPGRSFILIHSGNLAGDVTKGLRSDVEGCILLGLSRGAISGQPAVLESRRALTAFMRTMGGQPFTLHVVDGEA